ncbi:MAG: Peptidase, partial [uncultured Gemmatimonadetes bacterium]
VALVSSAPGRALAGGVHSAGGTGSGPGARDGPPGKAHPLPRDAPRRAPARRGPRHPHPHGSAGRALLAEPRRLRHPRPRASRAEAAGGEPGDHLHQQLARRARAAARGPDHEPPRAGRGAQRAGRGHRRRHPHPRGRRRAGAVRRRQQGRALRGQRHADGGDPRGTRAAGRHGAHRGGLELHRSQGGRRRPHGVGCRQPVLLRVLVSGHGRVRRRGGMAPRPVPRHGGVLRRLRQLRHRRRGAGAVGGVRHGGAAEPAGGAGPGRPGPLPRGHPERHRGARADAGGRRAGHAARPGRRAHLAVPGRQRARRGVQRHARIQLGRHPHLRGRPRRRRPRGPHRHPRLLAPQRAPLAPRGAVRAALHPLPFRLHGRALSLAAHDGRRGTGDRRRGNGVPHYDADRRIHGAGRLGAVRGDGARAGAHVGAHDRERRRAPLLVDGRGDDHLSRGPGPQGHLSGHHAGAGRPRIVHERRPRRRRGRDHAAQRLPLQRHRVRRGIVPQARHRLRHAARAAGRADLQPRVDHLPRPLEVQAPLPVGLLQHGRGGGGRGPGLVLAHLVLRDVDAGPRRRQRRGNGARRHDRGRGPGPCAHAGARHHHPPGRRHANGGGAGGRVAVGPQVGHADPSPGRRVAHRAGGDRRRKRVPRRGPPEQRVDAAL